MEAQVQSAQGRQTAVHVALNETELKTLDAVIQATTINDQNEKAQARSEIDLLISKVMAGQIKLEGRVERALRQYIVELDEAISAQVSAVMHHEKFQRLEATWRGLSYVVRNTQIIKDIQLCVLNVTRDELNEDLKSAKAFDKSLFYRKLVDDV